MSGFLELCRQSIHLFPSSPLHRQGLPHQSFGTGQGGLGLFHHEHVDIGQQRSEQRERPGIGPDSLFGLPDCRDDFLRARRGTPPVLPGENHLRIYRPQVTSRTYEDVMGAKAKDCGRALGHVRYDHCEFLATLLH